MSVRIPAAVQTAAARDEARRWTRGTRYAAAAALSGLGVLWFVAAVISFGHDGQEGATWTAAHPLLSGLGLSADMLAVPLIFAAAMIWFTLSRSATPRWAWSGVVLLACAAAGQGVLLGVELVGYIVARQTPPGLDSATLSAALDGASGPPMVTFMVLFFAGAFLGILVSMVAVWRARALPRAAVVLVLLSQAVEVVDVPLAGTGLGLIALTWMAVDLVRVRRIPAQVSRAA
jgi:hypothetical protein